MLGLYFHIPFCASKCGYCDFYSFPGTQAQMEEYTAALCEKITAFPVEPVDTVYFGGGTPSLLGGARLAMVLRAAREHFALTQDAEITAECNPDSMDETLLRTLKEAGFNRLSIGIQSAHEDELRLLGRRHTFPQAQAAVGLARACGFGNLALDLMYALPGQTVERILQSVDALLELDPTHLSCYGLTLEEGTPLYRVKSDQPGEDAQAEMYLAICERLAAAGFEHYEISNFCRPGKRARHNAKYWDLSEYLGIGAAAHSYYRGRRFEYSRDAAAFVRGEPPVPEEEVGGFDARAEYLMLRLRTSDGVSRDEYVRRFGDFAPVERTLERLQPEGLTSCDTAGCRLTERGFLVSNSIIALLL